eukprot:1195655-Prorocentrum_minimum.AAC.2
MAQETLDTYGVRHDAFDFESELGWEGSNDKVRRPRKPSLSHSTFGEFGAPEILLEAAKRRETGTVC